MAKRSKGQTPIFFFFWYTVLLQDKTYPLLFWYWSLSHIFSLCYRDVSVYNYNSNGCVLHMFDANLSSYLFTWCNLRFLYELSFFLFFISTVVLLSLVLFSISSLFSHIPRTLVLLGLALYDLMFHRFWIFSSDLLFWYWSLSHIFSLCYRDFSVYNYVRVVFLSFLYFYCCAFVVGFVLHIIHFLAYPSDFGTLYF
jgi:hypothetical protein